jgi:glycine/D-amino acid oxidase-like deaminating enzyme
MLDWVARFVTSCSRSAYARGLATLQRAAAIAGPAFDRLADRGVEFERHDQPLLYTAFEHAELELLRRLADELRDAGDAQTLRQVSAEELRELEPALGPDLVGGVIADGERRVRPELFTRGLRRAVEARGAEVRQGAPVTALGRDDGAWLVRTPSATFRAAHVVLAAGMACKRLLAGLGVRLSIAAAKGYSRTYAAGPTAPRRALYLEAPKVAVSVFDGGVRVSGTLEPGAVPPPAGRDRRRRPAGDAGLGDARAAARLGRDAVAVARRTTADRARARPGRPAPRHRSRDARDHARAGHRRAAQQAAARRRARSAVVRVRPGAVCQARAP